MKKLLPIFLLFPSLAFAEDITCEKSHKDSHRVHCKTTKVMDVTLGSINGGECDAPAFHWRGKGEFAVPGTKRCGYVGAVSLTVDGKNKVFAPL